MDWVVCHEEAGLCCAAASWRVMAFYIVSRLGDVPGRGGQSFGISCHAGRASLPGPGRPPGLCGSERGRLVTAAEGRGIIGGRAPLTGITLVLEPPWCRSPTCSPPRTGSPTPAAARDGATR